MFLHIYKYKLKSQLRKKEELFWILFFPIILCTFFFLAFSKISSSTEDFKAIDVAIVLDDENSEIFFTETMSSMEGTYFISQYTDSDTAKSLLNGKEVTAIIYVNDGIPTVTVRENGIYETMVKAIMDNYLQMSEIMAEAGDSPENEAAVIATLTSNAEAVVTKQLTNGNTDNMLEYYYSLIAMACMFATLSGQYCAKDLKANLSPEGMRKSLSPTNRMTLILSDVAACYTIHLISNLILVCYMQYVLKLNLGGSFPAIYAVTMTGSLIGLSVGVLIGSIPNISDGAKVGINIAFSLVSSFMSGLMFGGIKNIIEKHIPILNRINPSSLISDALYSINVYDDFRVYGQRLLIMGIMTIVLWIFSFVITRREKYDSI